MGIPCNIKRVKFRPDMEADVLVKFIHSTASIYFLIDSKENRNKASSV